MSNESKFLTDHFQQRRKKSVYNNNTEEPEYNLDVPLLLFEFENYSF